MFDPYRYAGDLDQRLRATRGVDDEALAEQLQARALLDTLIFTESDLRDVVRRLEGLLSDAQDTVKGLLDQVKERNSLQEDFEESYDRLQQVKGNTIFQLDTLEAQEHMQAETTEGPGTLRERAT